MTDDYLWDPSATPDPEIERLEQMLGRLKTTAPPPAMPDGRSGYVGVRFLAPALAAAAAIVLMVGLTWRNAAPPASAEAALASVSWQVAAIIGTPRVGNGALVGEGRIAVGQTLTTDEGSRAKIEVGDIDRKSTRL